MPKIVDHEAYRTELLTGCFALFAERGFAATTMREVARRLGVSTGTLYHYFPTKEAILAALVPAVGGSLVERAVDAMAGLRSRARRKAALTAFVADHEAELSGLLSIVLDARRQGIGDPAVAETTRLLRAAIADQLRLDEEAAARVFERLLGHVAHRMLDSAAPDSPAL